MPMDWESAELSEGLACYCRQDFFDAHEHWESVWLRLPEPEKTFLQALIQITAAFHHLQRNNRIGTRSLLTRALRRLDVYPADYGGVAVEPLRQSVRAWLLALGDDAVPPLLPYPLIR
jgi:uncharacterized protein